MTGIVRVCTITFCLFSLLYAQGVHMYYEGNSLTDKMSKLFRELAHDGGYPEHAKHGVGSAGIPIDWSWENQRKDLMWTRGDGSIFKVFQTYSPFDFVQVQPYGHNNTRKPVDEADAAAQIYATGLKYSPDCTLMVYFTWTYNPTSPKGDFSSLAEWEAKMHDVIDNHFWPIADMCSQYFPENPVYVVPSGAALLALNDSIKAGKLPRFSGIEELYNDGVHMLPNGEYLNACVQYASIYQKSPIGLPHEYTYNWSGVFEDPATKSTDLTAEEAAIFQRTAWDVVRNFPQTLVTKTKRQKTDNIAPSAVTGISVSNITKTSFDLSWNASSDNVGIEEYFVYGYADGQDYNATFRWTGTIDGSETSATITGCTAPSIQPGTTYKVIIRARDALYNLSPVTDTVMVTTESTVKGDKWKFDFGIGTSPVAENYTEFLATEYYDTVKGYGYMYGGSTNRFYSNTEETDNLFTDGHRVMHSPTFLMDVPNGDYNVKVYFISCDGCSENIDIYAEDTKVREGITVTEGGQAEEFTVTVEDQQLTIRIKTVDGGVKRYIIAGMEITPPTVITMHTSNPSHDTRVHMQLHPHANALTAFIPGVTISSYRVLDLQGKTIIANNCEREHVTIPINSIHSGLYILQIHTKGTVTRKRFVIP